MTRIRFTGTGKRPKSFREAVLAVFPNGLEPSPLGQLLRQCRDDLVFDPPNFFPLKLTRFQNETFVGKCEVVGFFAPLVNLQRGDVVLNERNLQVCVLLIHQRADGYVAMKFRGSRRRKYLDVQVGDYFFFHGVWF